MKLNSIQLELNHEEALDLRSLLEGFFQMQREKGVGEGSPRITLASHLLDVLPNHLRDCGKTAYNYEVKQADDSDEIPF